MPVFKMSQLNLVERLAYVVPSATLAWALDGERMRSSDPNILTARLDRQIERCACPIAKTSDAGQRYTQLALLSVEVCNAFFRSARISRLTILLGYKNCSIRYKKVLINRRYLVSGAIYLGLRRIGGGCWLSFPKSSF